MTEHKTIIELWEDYNQAIRNTKEKLKELKKKVKMIEILKNQEKEILENER